MQLTSHLESDSRVVAVSGYPLVLSRTLEPDLSSTCSMEVLYQHEVHGRTVDLRKDQSLPVGRYGEAGISRWRQAVDFGNPGRFLRAESKEFDGRPCARFIHVIYPAVHQRPITPM